METWDYSARASYHQNRLAALHDSYNVNDVLGTGNTFRLEYLQFKLCYHFMLLNKLFVP